MSTEHNLKNEVYTFWDNESCGEVYAVGLSEMEYYESQADSRYKLEPYIRPFATFSEGLQKDVLEIGIGMGADHIEWAKSKPHTLAGIDLTPRAVDHVSKRLKIYSLHSDLRVADAEALPFNEATFDLVYSWGVLHHSPNTPAAINEVHRVLRKDGITRIMIYHTASLVGYMLWIRYALMKGRPFRSMRDIYSNHLESPGTKAYSVKETRKLFEKFSTVDIRVQLSFGDLLEGEVGQHHRGSLLTFAKKIWPRKIIRTFCKGKGLYLCIEAKK